MVMMQYGLTNQWPRYPLGLHIRCTTSIKFMPDRIAPRLPPLDLRKKKGKVPPHNKPMSHQGPKDNVALHPIPYDWSSYFTRDAATKTIA